MFVFEPEVFQKCHHLNVVISEEQDPKQEENQQGSHEGYVKSTHANNGYTQPGKQYIRSIMRD